MWIRTNCGAINSATMISAKAKLTSKKFIGVLEIKMTSLFCFKVSSCPLYLNFTSQIIFSNPKIKQRNVTYLPSFHTDIKTVLQSVLTVRRTNASFTILIYIFNPSGVIYTQDKRILDITAFSISESLLRYLIAIKK